MFKRVQIKFPRNQTSVKLWQRLQRPECDTEDPQLSIQARRHKMSKVWISIFLRVFRIYQTATLIFSFGKSIPYVHSMAGDRRH